MNKISILIFQRSANKNNTIVTIPSQSPLLLLSLRLLLLVFSVVLLVKCNVDLSLLIHIYQVTDVVTCHEASECGVVRRISSLD